MLTKQAEAHLAWIKKMTPTYDFGGNWRGTYHETMAFLYSSQPLINQEAQIWFDHDVQKYEETQELIRTTVLRAQQVAHLGADIDPLFITLGFNHQTWSIPRCLKVIQCIQDLGWVQSLRAVFELHRENGLHPHVHIYIEPNVKYSKSKVLEKLWAVAGIKRVILQKSFIDYKIAMPYHLDYIMLRKKEEKMYYVNKDTQWRSDEGIPIIEKEWIHN